MKPEKFSCSSSINLDEDEDWQEEVKGSLVCGASNTFRIMVQGEYAESILSISVWPTIRMPTSSSSIPLINAAFLFATRNHIEEAHEIDFLVAQALLNARKFI
jgi:hypothetical protein